MKITLVPPILYQSDRNDYNLGILLLDRILVGHEHEVKIISFQPKKDELAIDNYYKECAEKILASQPDLVGFSTICVSYPLIILIAQELKHLRPDLTIVFGGIQASLTAKDTLLNFPQVDYIIAGESEITFPIFLNCLQNNIPFPENTGTYYRSENGNIEFTGNPKLITDLDSLPIINYEKLNLTPKDSINIDIGRGCPFQCYYCCTNNYWNRTFRFRSIQSILDEIKYIYDNFGVNNFLFNHDLLTCNKKVLKELIDGIKNLDFPIRWSCSSRIDTIDPNIIKDMANAGCNIIYFGIETGSPQMQKISKKNLDLSHVFTIIDACRENDVNYYTSFITGMPEETIDDLMQTLELMYECGKREAFLQLHLLTPFQGTDVLHKYQHKLYYDGTVSNVGGLKVRNEKEEEIIKAHPSIFSNFYYIENEHMPREFFQHIEKIKHLFQHHWRSIGLLLFTFNHSLEKITTEYVALSKKEIKISKFFNEFNNIYHPESDLLKDVIKFEKKLLHSYTRGRSPETSSNEISLSDCYTKQYHSRVTDIHFNPDALDEAIYNNLPFSHKTESFSVLIPPTYSNKTPQFYLLSLNALPISIYSELDGKLSVEEIIKKIIQYYNGKFPEEKIKNQVLKSLSLLKELNMITLIDEYEERNN